MFRMKCLSNDLLKKWNYSELATNIDISFKYIGSIGQNAFEFYVNIEVLTIYKKNHLLNLKVLILSSNKLDTILADSFNTLTKLENLFIATNRLSRIRA